MRPAQDLARTITDQAISAAELIAGDVANEIGVVARSDDQVKIVMQTAQMTFDVEDLYFTDGVVISELQDQDEVLVCCIGMDYIVVSPIALGESPGGGGGGTGERYTGEIVGWGNDGAAPSGWLECDGSAVSRTVYADLFAKIGEHYGVGDGSTTFNLPPETIEPKIIKT